MDDDARPGAAGNDDGAGGDALGRAYGRWVRRRREALGLTVGDAVGRLDRVAGPGWEPTAWTRIERRARHFPEAPVFRAMVAALESTEADALRAVGLLPGDGGAGQGGAA